MCRPMSQCGDYVDINFYVINVFYGIVIAVYFFALKKITLYTLPLPGPGSSVIVATRRQVQLGPVS